MTDKHEEERKELIMQVEGMTSQGCADAVADAIRRLDPSAEIAVDLGHSRITVRTFAQSLEVVEALGKAGYQAKGMTL